MASNNRLLQAALELAGYGYKVFPLAPNSKRPLISSDEGGRGCKDATTDEEIICDWWQAEPNANIGLSTDGLLVVDIDGANNPWISDSDKLNSLSSHGAISETPRGGLHCIFKQPLDSDYRNTVSVLAPNVDTRANGGYIVTAPSVVNGKSYQWLETYELNESIEQLAIAPDWITEKLKEGDKQPLMLPEDGVLKKGTQHTMLFRMGCKLRRTGHTFDEINVLLQVANQKRCEVPGTAAEVEAIAKSCAKYEPDQIEQADTEGWADEYLKPEEEKDPGPFPQSLLNVPGYISEVIKYTLKGSHRRQPEMSLAASIALMGVLTGRKITDGYGTRTNVYCLGVCRSGGGKDHPRKVNKKILQESFAEELLGSEGIASHAGLVAAVEQSNSILFQLDEIGRLIKTVANPSSSPHLYHIATVLMKLFTSADSLYIGDAYADIGKVKKIDQPHACIFGTTVPQSLYEGLTTESVTDGFLSRMMIFEASDHSPKPNGGREIPVPETIINQTKQWVNYSGGDPLITKNNPTLRVVPYDSHAETIFQDLEDIAYQAQQTDNEMLACLWTRTVEKARKLALIYACSESVDSPNVSREAAQWACGLSKYLTQKMIYLATNWVSENQFDALRKKILRIIKDEGMVGLTTSQLCRKTQSIKKKDRTEAVESLLLGGYIRPVETPTKTKTQTAYIAN